MFGMIKKILKNEHLLVSGSAFKKKNCDLSDWLDGRYKYRTIVSR